MSASSDREWRITMRLLHVAMGLGIAKIVIILGLVVAALLGWHP